MSDQTSAIGNALGPDRSCPLDCTVQANLPVDGWNMTLVCRTFRPGREQFGPLLETRKAAQ